MKSGRRGSAATVWQEVPRQGASTPYQGEAMQFPSVRPRTAHSMGKESYHVNLRYQRPLAR
jgi:hypothetical protein